MNTVNRFYALSDPESELENQEKSAKFPPIFVDRVINIQSLIKLLNDVIRDIYEIKVLKDEMIKIQLKTIKSYRTVVKELKLKNTKFHNLLKIAITYLLYRIKIKQRKQKHL